MLFSELLQQRVRRLFRHPQQHEGQSSSPPLLPPQQQLYLSIYLATPQRLPVSLCQHPLREDPPEGNRSVHTALLELESRVNG